jgi:hypothetical protein
MPDRTVSTRAPITGRSTPTIAAPTIAPTRNVTSVPVIPSTRTETTVGRTVEPYVAPIPPSQTALSDINQKILTNASNYLNLGNAIGGPYSSGSLLSNIANGNSSVDTNNPQTNQPIYGTGNPFDILGDAFSRAFGGSTYNPQPQQPSTIVQPVGSSGAGSSIALLLILGAVGVGVWYWYKHRG